jgi:hypothetical protein
MTLTSVDMTDLGSREVWCDMMQRRTLESHMTSAGNPIERGNARIAEHACAQRSAQRTLRPLI